MSDSRRLILAAPRSFCAGVERAIATVDALLAENSAPVYVHKQIVHNTRVVADLASRGAIFVDQLTEVPDGSLVVFSAHGVSPAVRAAAADRELEVVDATCPLVARVHAAAKRYAAEGYTVVLVGHAGHEEVEGTLGEAGDRAILVESVDDVAELRPPNPSRIVILTQTTMAIDETAEIIAAARARFPDAVIPKGGDICYATTNRQAAVRIVADESDVVLIVGSPNSSNANSMVEQARRRGTAAFLVEDADGILPRWLEEATTVGVSAGASTPESVVNEVVARLGQFGSTVVREHAVCAESQRFRRPPLPVNKTRGQDEDRR